MAGNSLASISTDFSITDAALNEVFAVSETFSYSSLKGYDKRLMTVNLVDGAKDMIGLGGASVGKGTFLNPVFFIVINRSTSGDLRLGLKITGGDTCYHRIPPGGYYISTYYTIDSNTGGSAFSAFGYFDTVNAQGETGEVDVEYLIAHI